MGKTKIDWPGLDYTWNPITGCLNNCGYCVVRNRVWNRIKQYYGNASYDVITEHPDRFDEPLKHKKPKTFFVGFYSDIVYWTKEQKLRVLQIIEECEQHTFMFLSKDPLAYSGIVWPYNCLCGLTMTKCEDDSDFLKFISFVKYTQARRFVSIEPIEGEFKFNMFQQGIEKYFVGAQTGPKITPKSEWIKSIIEHVPGDRLHWKNNIVDHVKTLRENKESC